MGIGALPLVWTPGPLCRRRRQAGSTLQAEDLQRAQSGFQDSLLVPSPVPSPASYAYQVTEKIPLQVRISWSTCRSCSTPNTLIQAAATFHRCWVGGPKPELQA